MKRRAGGVETGTNHGLADVKDEPIANLTPTTYHLSAFSTTTTVQPVSATGGRSLTSDQRLRFEMAPVALQPACTVLGT